MVKEKKLNPAKITTIITAGILAIAIVVVLIFVFLNKKNEEQLDTNFFITTDKKIVMPVGADEQSVMQMGAKQTYQVYSNEGDKITSAFLYIEFDNNEKAQKAMENEDIKKALEAGTYKGYKVDDKYLILEMPEESYRNITTSQIRDAADYFELVQKEKEQNNSEKRNTEVDKDKVYIIKNEE